ncbi:MAG: nucleotidyl transferase AbiEii/AbiGii toxin family protein [Gammaproteobacteria bacterium]|nr:nucleotidyl transferase AbiEii/AbiGii toxin family protein [Gammaproteobacteria bacterium]
MHPIFSEQVRLLVTVMPYISQETCFALKGGTAINLFLRDMPRLSVDLDYAGKLCAALDRQHPRDLFDVHFLLANEGITPALKDTFLIYLISSNRPMAELLAPNRHDISAVYASEFVGMTHAHVPLAQLLAAREQMIATIHTLLTDHDREFLLSIKRGKPDWSLCAFPQAANLPAVRWKLHNLANMQPNQHRQALAKLATVLTERR